MLLEYSFLVTWESIHQGLKYDNHERKSGRFQACGLCPRIIPLCSTFGCWEVCFPPGYCSSASSPWRPLLDCHCGQLSTWSPWTRRWVKRDHCRCDWRFSEWQSEELIVKDIVEGASSPKSRGNFGHVPVRGLEFVRAEQASFRGK